MGSKKEERFAPNTPLVSGAPENSGFGMFFADRLDENYNPLGGKPQGMLVIVPWDEMLAESLDRLIEKCDNEEDFDRSYSVGSSICTKDPLDSYTAEELMSGNLDFSDNTIYGVTIQVVFENKRTSEYFKLCGDVPVRTYKAWVDYFVENEIDEFSVMILDPTKSSRPEKPDILLYASFRLTDEVLGKKAERDWATFDHVVLKTIKIDDKSFGNGKEIPDFPMFLKKF